MLESNICVLKCFWFDSTSLKICSDRSVRCVLFLSGVFFSSFFFHFFFCHFFCGFLPFGMFLLTFFFFCCSVTAAQLLRCLLFIMFKFRFWQGQKCWSWILCVRWKYAKNVCHTYRHTAPKMFGQRNQTAQTNQVDFLINAHRIDVLQQTKTEEKQKKNPEEENIRFGVCSHFPHASKNFRCCGCGCVASWLVSVTVYFYYRISSAKLIYTKIYYTL